MQRYAGRRVLITGAGSGIGQACALRILDEGGRVAAADISEAGLQDTAAKAGSAGTRLRPGPETTVRSRAPAALNAGISTAVA